MLSMYPLYLELGLIFLFPLRPGLTLVGVVRSFGMSWSEFPVSPFVTPGPTSAPLDAAKFPEGVRLPAFVGVCSATVASPTA